MFHHSDNKFISPTANSSTPQYDHQTKIKFIKQDQNQRFHQAVNVSARQYYHPTISSSIKQ